ncbi:hypothetical protein VTN96DRAFT_7461 [Rasamsonia emersonii]
MTLSLLKKSRVVSLLFLIEYVAVHNRTVGLRTCCPAAAQANVDSQAREDLLQVRQANPSSEISLTFLHAIRGSSSKNGLTSMDRYSN